jgi:hypothetical protein
MHNLLLRTLIALMLAYVVAGFWLVSTLTH